MKSLLGQAKLVAAADMPVLIQGETGAGKEVLAQAIHAWSARAGQALVSLNCAAIPGGLIESELFGHVKGAFSGATTNRAGRFTTANGGTLLLDEIGDLSLEAQAKLLRVLQSGTFEAVGSDRTQKVDVRVLAASHVDLQKAVADGKFREDLYYRLAVFPLFLPPLRERREDIVPLSEQILARIQGRTGRGPWQLGEDAVALLERRDWPGNVRELVNALERATILRSSGILRTEDFGMLAPRIQKPAVDAGPFPTMEEAERRHIQAALARTGGKIYGPDGAAALLELPPTTLQSRMKKLEIVSPKKS
jgi:transcriptional regulator with GAF, ATPase, and Fis domain